MFGLVVLGVIVLWVYCVLDVMNADQEQVRNLSKPAWIGLVALVPLVGSIAWLTQGRPQDSGLGFTDVPRPAPRQRRRRPVRVEQPEAPLTDGVSWEEKRARFLQQWEEQRRRSSGAGDTSG